MLIEHDQLASKYEAGLQNTVEFRLATAAMSLGGLELISPPLRAFLQTGRIAKFLIGIDMNTTAEALHELLDICEAGAAPYEVKVFASLPGELFHPKLAIFDHFAIVGSSNLTVRGFTKNMEVNITVDGDARSKLQEWFDLFFDARGKTIDHDWVEVEYVEAGFGQRDPDGCPPRPHIHPDSYPTSKAPPSEPDETEPSLPCDLYPGAAGLKIVVTGRLTEEKKRLDEEGIVDGQRREIHHYMRLLELSGAIFVSLKVSDVEGANVLVTSCGKQGRKYNKAVYYGVPVVDYEEFFKAARESKDAMDQLLERNWRPSKYLGL